MSVHSIEYRVHYKREGHRPKERRYVRLERAARLARVLLDPSLDRPPDDVEGSGLAYDAWIARMPRLEWVRLEQREVGPWGDVGP